MKQPSGGLRTPSERVPAPTYARTPRISTTVSLQTSLATALGVLPGREVLTVGAPGLFRLLSSNVAAGQGAVLDVYWRALGEELDVAALGNNPPGGQRMPFVGPYAWFPAAGQYEVTGASLTSVGTALILRGEVEHEVSEADWLGIAAGEGSRNIQSGNIVIAAGGSNDLPFPGSFFLYRSILLQNVGAAAATIQFGVPGVNALYTLAVGATVEFRAPYLGRHTIRVGAAAATTLALQLSLW
jgi:hypothetical protein